MSTLPPSRIDDPERWRRRAENVRRRAEDLVDLPLARESSLRTAETYEKWARQEEERRNSK